MKLHNKRILITGATGFVGANLTRDLVDRRCEIAIFSRRASDFWRIKDIKSKLKNFSVDLREYNKVEKALRSFKPHVVFHLGCYGVYPNQKDIDTLLKTNVLGTFNLLEAAIHNNLELFVNVGTLAEYGIKQKIMKEGDLLEPVNIYGATKAASTLISHAFFRKFNLPVVNVRLFTPYGYFEDRQRFMPSFILACLLGRSVKLTPGWQKRDFIFIDDVIRALLKTVEFKNRAMGNIVNIGSGKELSLREVARIILSELGNPIKPKWGAIDYRENEFFKCQADINKAKQLLHWHPEVNLREGISKTINWFRENSGKFKHYD